MQTATTVTVGERDYTVTTFPAFKGLSYLQKLMKVFGPSLGEIMSNVAADGEVDLENFSIEDEALSKAISLLTENLDKSNVAQLAQEMIKEAVTINGQTVRFDQEFSANYGALIKLLTAIIRENYSSFFDESGFGGLRDMLPQPRSNDE